VRKIIIEEKIFEIAPSFKWGVIVVSDIDNAKPNAKIQNLLAAEVEKRKLGHNSQNPEVLAWDEIHRKFGSNPNKFPPSIKNLLKRIEKGTAPPFINSVVALFNYISLKYLIPCGGDDAEKIKGNLRLSIAKGDEQFIGLGSTENEPPVPGEIIYYDDQTLNIMCRRFNWRNGDFSKILPESKKLVINIDGIDPVGKETIIQARDELAELLESECSAQIETDYLDINKKELELSM